MSLHRPFTAPLYIYVIIPSLLLYPFYNKGIKKGNKKGAKNNEKVLLVHWKNQGVVLLLMAGVALSQTIASLQNVQVLKQSHPIRSKRIYPRCCRDGLSL